DGARGLGVGERWHRTSPSSGVTLDLHIHHSAKCNAMGSPQQRHRVLAGMSRARLLTVLGRSARPMGVRELAEAVELHPNTVRQHLDQLVEAGLAVRDTAPPICRGRPAPRYAAEPGSAEPN